MPKVKLTPIASVAVSTVTNDDPTLQTKELEIQGNIYTLCFDLRSLARAEREMRAAGIDINILYALPGQTLDSLLLLFAAALRRFHPEISYEAACALLRPRDISKLYDIVASLWEASMPSKGGSAEKNPIQPGK